MNRILGVTAVLTVLALSSACSGDEREPTRSRQGVSASPSPSASPHNAWDLTFARGLLGHHEKASRIAAFARTRSTDARVRALATTVYDAQARDITALAGLLRSWGAMTPEEIEEVDHHATGDHAEKELSELASSRGSQFDRMFLDMMIPHHAEVAEMAETEVREGMSADAKALAESVRSSQAATIEQMRAIRESLA